MFHKPRGCVVTRSDEHSRRTVFDLLPAWVHEQGWQPVGRLDMDTRGLLLFVNDGKLQEQLSRPGVHRKVYEVWVRGRVTPEHAAQLLAGVDTPAGRLRAATIELRGGAGGKSRVLVTLDEGRNRQIRRMFSALKDETSRALKVTDLKRTSFGPVQLDIQSGQWRWLTEAEQTALDA
ncbi:MAG: rRNA pseudouridine synthase [Planctomycetes bacterium]|nr:rRNA pseudouridine synthase [Planctomycetota bacterium]MCW8135290.1 rRNA pseudouridine synthase [Planctomycetota bacterium]